MKKISNIRYHIIPSENTNHDTFFRWFLLVLAQFFQVLVHIHPLQQTTGNSLNA